VAVLPGNLEAGGLRLISTVGILNQNERRLMMKIMIKSGSFSRAGIIYDTPTGNQIYNNLPIKGRVNRWGKEIYFSIPVEANLEVGASDVVAKGDLAYWPVGNAFCIFFGPTPASRKDEIRAASPVNVFGQVEGDLENLEKVKNGSEIIVEKR
jgi:hypothetical protein